jgi:hypothetical protein
MGNDRNNELNPVERALLELDEAERAGVFSPTPLCANRHGARPLFQSFRFWVPFAAAAALAISGWTTMFLVEINSIRAKRTGVLTSGNVNPGESVAFADCLSGPGRDLALRCMVYDFDADGDVDLADFGRSQQTGFQGQ